VSFGVFHLIQLSKFAAYHKASEAPWVPDQSIICIICYTFYIIHGKSPAYFSKIRCLPCL
jgi:hypothetical protein